MPPHNIGLMNSLLTAEHKRAMPPAGLWYFAQLVDWQTAADGWVLGGRPVAAAELAQKLGDCKDTALRVLDRLESRGYITRRRAPGGFRIRIERPQKHFRREKTPGPANPDQGDLPFADPSPLRVDSSVDSLEPRVDSSVVS